MRTRWFIFGAVTFSVIVGTGLGAMGERCPECKGALVHLAKCSHG